MSLSLSPLGKQVYTRGHRTLATEKLQTVAPVVLSANVVDVVVDGGGDDTVVVVVLAPIINASIDFVSPMVDLRVEESLCHSEEHSLPLPAEEVFHLLLSSSTRATCQAPCLRGDAGRQTSEPCDYCCYSFVRMIQT